MITKEEYNRKYKGRLFKSKHRDIPYRLGKLLPHNRVRIERLNERGKVIENLDHCNLRDIYGALYTSKSWNLSPKQIKLINF